LHPPLPITREGAHPPSEGDNAAKATVATTGTGDSDDDVAAGIMTGPMAAAGSETGMMVAMAAARQRREGRRPGGDNCSSVL
jgi:hypothetical protein